LRKARIEEYLIPFDDTFTLSIPKNSKFLTVSNQNDYIYLIYQSYSKVLINVSFRLVSSKEPFNESEYIYLGSFGLRNWSLRYHLLQKR